ncbi:MAG: hypothetical protein ACTH14_00365 [Jeotgalicoccus sp.]
MSKPQGTPQPVRPGEYLNAHNDNVHEFKANGFNMLDFSETYIEEE